MRLVKTLLVINIILCGISFAQNNYVEKKAVYVDDSGVMRWKENNEEVTLFGINYTTPFAYSYRAHKKLDLSLKKAIDLDVAHMVRLGLDAFRVHMWDREISDRDGNLLKNEHLDLFDYLLAQLSKNGIRSIITPIAWWGTGWPEPDIETPGFSQVYSKQELITNPKAREAQRNYLRQIMNHVNHYKKKSYKEEPDIIAVEIINEPKHPNNQAQVTEYVNEMYDVLRKEGLTKPVFYNISENWNDVQAKAVSNSKAEGVSFQWYPTGLVHNKMLDGNYLINVNKYLIPSKDISGFDKKAKMVYEFDAADVGGSYMYPAMARSYRETGMQFAAMFSYDPVQIAWSNTEYPTHFVNLLYTPSKAISLLIASKVFHKLKRNQSYGEYPSNNSFDDFLVNAEANLSSMNSEECFYYTNNFSEVPKDGKLLKHIAGVGNSTPIQYEGTGAYFLDKLDKGIWRLEVYPDAVWLKDPFEQTSMSRQVSKLYWKERSMKISLTDLGQEFSVNLISNLKNQAQKSVKQKFMVKPGVYILASVEANKAVLQKLISKKEKFLDGLYKPSFSNSHLDVVNNTPDEASANSTNIFHFTIASEEKIENSYLYIRKPGWRGFEKVPLKFQSGFNYIVADSLKTFSPGMYEYCLSVESGSEKVTFPDGLMEEPASWDFNAGRLWNIKIFDRESAITLLDPLRDRKDFIFPQWSNTMRSSIDYRMGEMNGSSIFVNVTTEKDNKNIFGLQLNVFKRIAALKENIKLRNTIHVKIRSPKSAGEKLEVILLQKNGESFKAELTLKKEWDIFEIPLSSFSQTDALILPNSYPQFLPKIWNADLQPKSNLPDLTKLEFIQIVIPRNTTTTDTGKKETSFELESVMVK